MEAAKSGPGFVASAWSQRLRFGGSPVTLVAMAKVWSAILFAFAFGFHQSAFAAYVGSASAASPNPTIESAALEVLGSGGGTGAFIYKGGGNAVDAAVAAALSACVVNVANCSLGGYGGHMMIWKSGWDGAPQLVTCIDFNSAAGSLANSNVFAVSVNPTNGNWIGALPAANLIGWKAVGVPGTFAGLYMAQTNYGRKVSGTNFFPFAEVLKPALARIANGQATVNSYYTTTSVSNLFMELFTNSNPYAAFYGGGIAQDIAAVIQGNGGFVMYADMTNYAPREVVPYMRHFNPPNGTPAWVCAAPLGSAALSVLQELSVIEALGWTNGPGGTWDTLHYWHARAETARLMWKDFYQWFGDPFGGATPPDFLGNGSTDFAAQMVAHATNGLSTVCPWDPNEIRLTNSIAGSITQAVNGETNVPILVHWNDIRYGTCNISTADKWGNCVAVTLSMGGGYGAQVALTNRGLVFGQGMALFEPRPGWPDSIAPGKRPVDNMCPIIVIPDFPVSPTNGSAGGRPPFAAGGVGGSTIENNMTMQVLNYLLEGPSSSVSTPANWLYNFEGNNIIYMRPSYPPGVQSYLGAVGLSAPGGPPSVGEVSYAEAWIPPELLSQPSGTNVSGGTTITLRATATGLPLFYQWLRAGVPLSDGGTVSGANTAQLSISPATNSAVFTLLVSNGGGSVTSAPANVILDGVPAISMQPVSRTNFAGESAAFTAAAVGPGTLTYRWRKNGANVTNGGNISGATAPTLRFNPVTVGDAGVYSVVVSNAFGSMVSDDASLTVINAAAFLTQLWSAGPLDGVPWMNTNTTLTANVPNQRTLAYNAPSNQLYVISRSSSTTSNFVVYVLNATNGSLLYTLKTNGIRGGIGKAGIGLVSIGVADDGAVYAANVSLDAAGSGGADPTSMFRVYRWADAGSNTIPVQIFSGDPAGTNAAMRWGDTLAVRGAGTNTQLLIDTDTTVSGTRYTAILTPTSGALTNFSARWFTATNSGNTIGRSLEFEPGTNSIWQKGAGAALVKTTFDPATSLGGARIASANALVATNFPPGLLGVGLATARNLAAGVYSAGGSGPDMLNLYDISNLGAPSLLSQYPFPMTPPVANANRISQTFFKDELVFSIDANNGFMVFRLTQSNPPGAWSLYEPFSYSTIGGPVSSNTPANWTYGGTGANDLSIVSGSLAYPGLVAPVGNSVTNGGVGLGVRRLLGTNFSSGAVYFSALFRIDDLGFGQWSGHSSAVGALCANDNSSFRVQVLVKSNSPSGYVFGVQKSGTGSGPAFDGTEHYAGETVFVVGKYDFNASPNSATLWINPAPATLGAATEPGTGFVFATSGTDGFVIDRFNMRQNALTGSSSVPVAMRWDELRFGLSWAAVTPPDPLYFAPGSVTLSGFNILPGGAFQFGYSNASARVYTVFASTNLVDWQAIGSGTQTSPGWYQFTDAAATNLARRFYQLRSP